MAIVRRAERQTSLTAIPGARRQAAETDTSAGAGLAQANVQKGETIAAVGGQGVRISLNLYEQIQRQEQESADQTALLKASNRIASWKNERLYDPKKGAFTQKGEAAQPLPEQISGEYKTLTGEIAKELTPSQQAAFAKMDAQEWQQIDLQVRRHVFDQMQAFKAGELKSAIQNHTNAAHQAFLDPKMVGVEMQKALDALRANGPALGMGAEELDLEERKIRTATHAGVIQNLLGAEKEKAAEIYFNAVKGQIDGDILDDLTKAIAIGSDKREAQEQFDAIRAAGGTYKEQLEKARKIEDPDVRDRVENYLDAEDARNKRDDRESHAKTLRGAFDVVDAGKGLRGIDPSVWRDLDGDERRSLQIYAVAKAEGIPIKTDQTVFYRYMRMATENPKGFIQANVLADKHRLSDSDFQQLAGLQVSIANGDRVAAGKLLDDYRTETQVINQALASAGIDPSPSYEKDPAQVRALAQLSRMVADRAQSLQTFTGKKATNKDLEQITDDILGQSVSVPGSFWNLWSSSSKRVINLTFDDIPDADVESVRKFLKAQGVPDSDDNILAYYIDAQSRIRKK